MRVSSIRITAKRPLSSTPLASPTRWSPTLSPTQKKQKMQSLRVSQSQLLSQKVEIPSQYLLKDKDIVYNEKEGLGSGSFGDVYLGVYLGAKVAVKII